MAGFNYTSDVQQNAARLKNKEQMLGKGLNIPFNAANSGSRKIMDIVHQTHALVLSRAEVPYIGTGYENEFGDYSSCIVEAEKTWIVIAKIPKFSEAPNHHYYLIVADAFTSELHVIERKAYFYRTEIYGYLINNTKLDRLAYTGAVINEGTRLIQSTGYDQHENKTNGANLMVAYMSTDNNMEDSIIISDVCSEKMRAPFIKKHKRFVNENDIPLFTYGNNDRICPEIGEDIKNGILMAFRREDKDNAIYTQAVSRLQEVMMSDDKVKILGKVIDIDIYCNNPSVITQNTFYSQLNKYYQDNLRMCRDVVNIVSPFEAQGYKLSYPLQEFFCICKEKLMGMEVIDKKRPSFITIEFTVMEDKIMDVGDKAADRYGGKGVVSIVVPQRLMPQLPNGRYVDMIKNSHTMYGRENAGQIFEIEENYISMCILDYCRSKYLSPDEVMNMVYRYLHIVSPQEEADMREYVNKLRQDDYEYFVMTILENECIHISNEPISDPINIDLIGALYDEFPWIEQCFLTVPIKNSNGDYRFVKTRRPMVVAPQYTYRLKQLAEEKFSATSLSSTNLRNENAKSKDSKNNKELHSNTPIRFGPMETGDFEHMGSDIVIFNMMMYSLSPIGRRALEEMYEGDPYNIDIKLNSKAKNRSVEQLNAKLKAMGYRMFFRKKKKVKRSAALFHVLEFEDDPNEINQAIEFRPMAYATMEEWEADRQKCTDQMNKNAVNMPALAFYGDAEGDI